jgi:hypothetical protein
MYLMKKHHANPSKNLSARREVVVVLLLKKSPLLPENINAPSKKCHF